MNVSQVYVRLDSMSNAVTSMGITLGDFQEAITVFPQNILLLSSETDAGEIDSNTGLKIIRGEEEIKNYFNLVLEQKKELKWIDFKNIELIQQMKPIEIAELLYFGHMKTQLHSPFFYKLQNNYVFFEQANDYGKIYYRNMDDFYAVLQNSLKNKLTECLNKKKMFFQKKIAVQPMEEAFLSRIQTLLQEGIIFDFSKISFKQEVYEIDLYVVEDKLREVSSKEKTVATISYDRKEEHWKLQTSEELEFMYGIKQA